MDSEDTVRTAERKHYTVLWTFDANTATPLSRTRLNTATTDLASGLAIIHAEAGKLSIHPPPRWCHRHPQHPIHRSRGLKMPGRWLGLLDDAEAAVFPDKMLLYPNLERPAPRKLWSRINNILTHLTADFQNPGLLGTNSQPLLLENPDSILIHHPERQLTLIAGPAGNTLWTTQLPFTVIQSVLLGAQTRPRKQNPTLPHRHPTRHRRPENLQPLPPRRQSPSHKSLTRSANRHRNRC